MKHFRCLYILFALISPLLLIASCNNFLSPEQIEEFSINPERFGNEAIELCITLPVNRAAGENNPIPDLPLIEDALNGITIPKINVRVKLIEIMKPLDQSVMLMLSTNQKIDIISMRSSDSFYKSGFLIPFDETLAEYTGIMNAIDGQLLAQGRYDSKQYSLPTNKDIVSAYGPCMRKDILDRYNIDASLEYNISRQPPRKSVALYSSLRSSIHT